MEKELNVRVMGFPKNTYDKVWLDTLSDKDLSDTALAEGDSEIYPTLSDFQNALNNKEIDCEKNWYYFLTDLA